MQINLIPEQMIEEVMRRNKLGIFTESKASLLLSSIMMMLGSAVFIRALIEKSLF